MPIKQAQAKLLNALADKGLSELKLATFKKDRSVTLHRIPGGWELIEQGFEDSTMPLSEGASAKRAIKEAFKREFPRSNKLYISEARTN